MGFDSRSFLAFSSASDDNLPNPQTLERFERTGAAIFRSDEDGLIVLRFDEGRISVGTERAE